jgi:hypothetical protein
LFQQQQLFFQHQDFFELQELLLFYFFVLSSSLSFQQQHKGLVHKTLEKMDAEIYGIFRLAPSTNMGQSLGGSGDDQL